MTNRPKILIVEDDAPTAEMAKALLTDAGCETSVVHTGRAGMELAAEKKFDLITLDVGLPDINGFEVCRELKQRHVSRHTPVVLVSGHASEDDWHHSFRSGAADFIQKPFKADGFASRLLAHVNTKGVETPVSA